MKLDKVLLSFFTIGSLVASPVALADNNFNSTTINFKSGPGPISFTSAIESNNCSVVPSTKDNIEPGPPFTIQLVGKGCQEAVIKYYFFYKNEEFGSVMQDTSVMGNICEIITNPENSIAIRKYVDGCHVNITRK